MRRMGRVGQTASLPRPFRGGLDLVEAEMCERARMVKGPEAGVTLGQLCRPLQQGDRLLLATRPDQSVAEREVSLGEAGLSEMDRCRAGIASSKLPCTHKAGPSTHWFMQSRSSSATAVRAIRSASRSIACRSSGADSAADWIFT